MLYFGQQMQSANDMPLSEAEAFIGGEAVKQWKKGREGEIEMQVAIVERLNTVIRALNNVASLVAGR